jgi:8-oxo-dGTP pyrophosphatase MutT (NUDIX family)
MPKVKSCGFLVYRHKPELSFLLMRHHDRWDLPKGHVDPGESKIQAAYRELFEETGIDGDHIRMDGRFEFKQRYRVPGRRYGLTGDIEKTLTIYLAELTKDVEIKAVEHLGHEWFTWNPPHDIQERTINPLLSSLDKFWKSLVTNPQQAIT